MAICTRGFLSRLWTDTWWVGSGRLSCSWSSSLFSADLYIPWVVRHKNWGYNHKMLVRQKPYSCRSCHKRFADENRLEKHLNRAHGSEESKTIQCKVCEKRFLTSAALGSHVRTHNGILETFLAWVRASVVVIEFLFSIWLLHVFRSRISVGMFYLQKNLWHSRRIDRAYCKSCHQWNLCVSKLSKSEDCFVLYCN